MYTHLRRVESCDNLTTSNKYLPRYSVLPPSTSYSPHLPSYLIFFPRASSISPVHTVGGCPEPPWLPPFDSPRASSNRKSRDLLSRVVAQPVLRYCGSTIYVHPFLCFCYAFVRCVQGCNAVRATLGRCHSPLGGIPGARRWNSFPCGLLLPRCSLAGRESLYNLKGYNAARPGNYDGKWVVDHIGDN